MMKGEAKNCFVIDTGSLTPRGSSPGTSDTNTAARYGRSRASSAVHSPRRTWWHGTDSPALTEARTGPSHVGYVGLNRSGCAHKMQIPWTTRPTGRSLKEAIHAGVFRLRIRSHGPHARRFSHAAR